jgi:hypothetical protein
MQSAEDACAHEKGFEMKITQENLKALTLSKHDAFRRSVSEILEQDYGWHPAVQTDIDRLSYVNAGIIKANKYGISIGPDAAKMVFLMLELSPSFDEDPRWEWARAILETNLKNKMDRLITVAALALKQGNPHE